MRCPWIDLLMYFIQYRTTQDSKRCLNINNAQNKHIISHQLNLSLAAEVLKGKACNLLIRFNGKRAIWTEDVCPRSLNKKTQVAIKKYI